MAADSLTRLLARVETALDGIARRVSRRVERAVAAAAPAGAPLPAGATRAVDRAVARETGRVFGRNAGAVLDRAGRPATPMAVVLDAGIEAAAALVGVAPPADRWTRPGPDGARLADRVVAAGDEARRQVRERVAWHVAQGTPVEDAAAEVASLLDPATSTVPGRDGGTDAVYAARRLVLNATRTAHGAAVVGAAAASGGRYLVRWVLSPAHEDDDECDEKASANLGFGPGVYPAGAVPDFPSHPNCRCRLVVVRAT
jgi:hypothetical protein